MLEFDSSKQYRNEIDIEDVRYFKVIMIIDVLFAQSLFNLSVR
jgi:hypothetical protein